MEKETIIKERKDASERIKKAIVLSVVKNPAPKPFTELDEEVQKAMVHMAMAIAAKSNNVSIDEFAHEIVAPVQQDVQAIRHALLVEGSATLDQVWEAMSKLGEVFNTKKCNYFNDACNAVVQLMLPMWADIFKK